MELGFIGLGRMGANMVIVSSSVGTASWPTIAHPTKPVK